MKNTNIDIYTVLNDYFYEDDIRKVYDRICKLENEEYIDETVEAYTFMENNHDMLYELGVLAEVEYKVKEMVSDLTGYAI